jgi:simple sugar transport system permease protein
MADGPEPPDAAADAKPVRPRFRIRSTLETGIFFVFILVWAIFLIGNPRVFTGAHIYYSLMSTVPFIGILALSVTLVVILGEMDLSFPSVLGISSWVFATTFAATHNLLISSVAGLAAGIACGWVNAILVVNIGIPSLVATIGTMFLFRGLTNVVAAGNGIALSAARGHFLYEVAVGRLFGVIPAQAIWMLGLGVVFWLLLNRHRFGGHLLFVGDNPESSRMMGINVNRVKSIAFIQVGFFAALVGILSTLEVTYFWPNQGTGYLLTALAAVFVGGTSVFGGMGTILGTFLGALIIGSLEAGIVAIGLTGFWTQLIYGAIITISVSIYALLMRRPK